MRKRIVKKFMSLLCVMTMVATSMTGFELNNVGADTTSAIILKDDGERAVLTEQAADADYNFALNKSASASRVTGGNNGGTDLSVVTNGAFSTTRSAATTVTIGQKIAEDKWVQVDLGKAYDTGEIDRVAVQYYSLNTSARAGYTILFSLNGVDFVEIGSVGAYTSAAGNPIICLDKITLTEEQAQAIPYARYVRVVAKTDNNNTNNGLQVMGMAVLTDGTTKVSEVEYQEVETLDDPVSLTVTSSGYEQLEYVFEAAKGDEGDYTYYAYIDGNRTDEAVIPKTSYVVTGLTGGNHTVKIVAFKNEVASQGIVKTIEVKDTKSLLTDDRNIAVGKTAVASSIRDEAVDLETNITDGNTATLFRTVTSDTKSTIVIDLGQNYRLDAMERTVALYAAGRYPKNYTIDYSLNGTDFETVATAEGTSELQTTLLESVECTLPAVRYMRFSLSNPVGAGYGFQMYELGVIVKEGADLTPVEVDTVYDPAGFDVQVTGYNTVDATIIAGENQQEYKYNIYIDNELVLREVTAGTYEIKDVTSGNKKFTVKSIVDGITSEGITVTREVQDAFTYTYETLESSVVEAGKVLETEKTDSGTTYYNYSLYKGVKASALSEENAVNTAEKAIDGDSTTRWSSIQGVDPQWYVVDLGNSYRIDEIDIVWQNASAKDFNIEVSQDGITYAKLGMVNSAATGSRYDNIKLTEETVARYVKITGTARTGIYGYSIWELGIYGPEEIKTVYYTVSVDGVQEEVAEGETYILPEDARYGYYADGKMYKSGSEITITEDMAFTSVNELSVTMAGGAGIRYIGTAGIRFQASIMSDNMDAINSEAITEGTLITAQDIYEAKEQELTLTSDYTKLNVVNSGWYNGIVGTYCGSICDVIESNYIRNFTARAYVTINYENAEALTVYSAMGPVRSISQVATAVKEAGYAGIAPEYHSVIDSMIK